MDIFVRFLSPVLMIVFGLGVGVVVFRELKVSWHLFGVGALTFVFAQVFHIPFNAWFFGWWQAYSFFDVGSGWGVVATPVLLGLSAGLFEEIARYLMYRFWVRDARRWADGLMLGAGHGGIEAVLLGAFALVTIINIAGYRGVDLSQQFSADELADASAQIAAFWAASPIDVFLGAAERLFAISFHLSASVMVLQVFHRKQMRWLWAAIGWHTLLNATAVFSVQRFGLYLTEGFLMMFAIVSIWIVFQLRGGDEALSIMPASAVLLDLHTDNFDDDAHDLEMSRYE